MHARYVDFHCHLDLYPDPEGAYRRCQADQVATLAVTTTPKAFRQNQIFGSKTDCVRVALGLHPHLAEERWTELPLFEGLLKETRYVGEVGLDAGPRFYKSLPRQTDVFRRILVLCAQQGGKILSIHSVRAASRVLDSLEELLPPNRGTAVLHWFSGSQSELRRATNLGCYFSVNQSMFEKDRGQALIKAIPPERLLTETDGPFLEDNGRPIEPGNVRGAVGALGQLLGLPHAQTQNLLLSNLTRLLE
ncbi:TatD DNase family protein [Rhizobium sp. SG_E_25_P2]|uniref:Qat anti-phage system TatD family nuclease QatD n=1 Tax=Rhizobium sp. SG_E_25_P2 TaxID=2879942 RepID=UPI002473159C|nr:Qat anti-phage system TatD family nuclease QatD [Rhizobium sp. SG_E_25_P2]MDH6268214.1 TatD DNase family protein [Rhizobium sp. SG_E_25_P2]